jgi:uncharacterized protein with GYD domain
MTGTFFLFGKYSPDATRAISRERTDQARGMIEKLGGKVKGIYALLGQHDLVIIVELPNMADAMKASIGLGRLTGASFSTAAAISADEFDKIIADI